MDRSLRNRTGRPNLRTRVVAGLVVVGLILLTAPIVVVPVARAVLGLVF